MEKSPLHKFFRKSIAFIPNRSLETGFVLFLMAVIRKTDLYVRDS